MIRETSVESYHKIKDDGLLSERRWQVYDVLYHHGPLTATGIANKMPGMKSQSVGANVHARLGELRGSGVVKEIGEVECSHTGMTVILWDVTDKLPEKFEKKQKPNLHREALAAVWKAFPETHATIRKFFPRKMDS